jgi:FtsH-binding integral membrane protein
MDKKIEKLRSDAVWDLLIQLFGIALFVMLIVAYSTGEEYPHTHVMIGYATAILLAVSLFWLVVKLNDEAPPKWYNPGEIKVSFQNVGRLAKTLAFLFAILAAVPLCALLIMLVTHSVWGTTKIDEMHEVAAYFAVGLIVPYVVMVGIASSGSIEGRLRKIFAGSKRPF